MVNAVILSSVMPASNAVEAANLIAKSILSELIRLNINKNKFKKIIYVQIFSENSPNKHFPEVDRKQFSDLGVEFFQLCVKENKRDLSSKLWSVYNALLGKPELFFVEAHTINELRKIIGYEPAEFYSIWSELGFNVVGGMHGLKFCYHGNPEPKVYKAYRDIEKKSNSNSNWITSILYDVLTWLHWIVIRTAHLRVARNYDLIAQVAHNDAQWYCKNGSRAVYVPNMWTASPLVSRTVGDRPEFPKKIIVSVGLLSNTGNTLAFDTLSQSLLSELRRSFGQTKFELHIFGSGSYRPYLKNFFDEPEVKVRGFVEDLDFELANCDVFLLPHNTTTFKVSHTRVLHAWSLGACVVAFADTKIAHPELVHDYNALLGNSYEEVAKLVFLAAHDIELNKRISEGGQNTLESNHNCEVISKYFLELTS